MWRNFNAVNDTNTNKIVFTITEDIWILLVSDDYFFLFEKKILSHRDKELTDELKSVSDIQQTIIHHIDTFLYISPDHESKSVNEEKLTFLSVDEKK